MLCETAEEMFNKYFDYVRLKHDKIYCMPGVGRATDFVATSTTTALKYKT